MTPQWHCHFLSLLAAVLCPDTCCTFVYCRLLLAIFNNRLSPLSFNAHLLPLSLCIAERMQQKWVFAAAVGMVLRYRRTRASKTLHHLSFGALRQRSTRPTEFDGNNGTSKTRWHGASIVWNIDSIIVLILQTNDS